MLERFHSIQVRADDAAEVALAIARRFRALGWKVVRDPKGRGAPAESGDPDGLRRFLISPSDRGWVTILPSGTPESGPDSLVAYLARELECAAVWFDRIREGAEEKLTYEVYWKNKRIDRQEPPAQEGKALSAYPTLIDHDLQSLGNFMPSGQKHPKITVAELPRWYPKYAGDKAFQGRFKKLVTNADYPMLWGTYPNVFVATAPEFERLESWGHLGFQREDGRSAAARLTHGDPAARRGAVEALASCAADEARPGLQAALADDDAEVRLAAATVVAARPDKGLAQDLADRLADEDVRVRVMAGKALKDMGVATTAQQLSEVALEDEVEVRRAAIAALGSIDSPIAREALLKAARKDKDGEVRRWAAEGLGRAQLGEVVNDLAKLLADKEPAVRGAAARASASCTARPPKLPSKLIDPLRKMSLKDKDEAVAADAIRALRSLLPQDEEVRDLAMKLAATEAKAGALGALAVRLPKGAEFDGRDKRIVTSLLKRAEKNPAADVIVALGNQAGHEDANDRILAAAKELVARLWTKPGAAGGDVSANQPGAILSRADLQTWADARSALVYTLHRINDAGSFPLLLKILDAERVRPVPNDATLAPADEQYRLQLCFAAMDAILDLQPHLKEADLAKLNERLVAWIGEAKQDVDVAGMALRRTALLAYGKAAAMAASAPLAKTSVPATPVRIEANGKAKKAAPVPAPAKPVPPPIAAPVLPNKAVAQVVRPLLNDHRWPEVATVLVRQLGVKSGQLLQAALNRSIDKEVRHAKKGGYSRREADLVGQHRRALVQALRELKDQTSVQILVRLVTLEALRAGKVERKAENSLLAVTVSTLQSLTGYKFGIEPQRWQEVAAGKLPPPSEIAKQAAAAAAKAAAKAGAAAEKAAGTIVKLATNGKVNGKHVNGKSAKKPVKLKAKAKPAKKPVAKLKAKPKTAKKPAKKSGLRSFVKRIASGAKRLTSPRRMAARRASRR